MLTFKWKCTQSPHNLHVTTHVHEPRALSRPPAGCAHPPGAPDPRASVRDQTRAPQRRKRRAAAFTKTTTTSGCLESLQGLEGHGDRGGAGGFEGQSPGIRRPGCSGSPSRGRTGPAPTGLLAVPPDPDTGKALHTRFWCSDGLNVT